MKIAIKVRIQVTIRTDISIIIVEMFWQVLILCMYIFIMSSLKVNCVKRMKRLKRFTGLVVFL